VATLTGNGNFDFKTGTLSEAMVHARYVSVDKDDNIFASVRDDQYASLVRINESENIVEALTLNDFHGDGGVFGTNQFTPNVSCVDPKTNIVYVAMDNNVNFYAAFDPKEGWLMHLHKFKMDPSLTALIGDVRANTIAVCSLDSCLYMRYGNTNVGVLVKIHRDTEEAELVCTTPLGLGSYGLAFHPIKKNLLYATFVRITTNTYNHSIAVLDITNPGEGFKKLNNSSMGGHRDGPVAQALFNAPMQICFDNAGNLFIVEADNHCVRMLSNDNMVSTVLGRPGVIGMQDGGKETALFHMPFGVAVGTDGSMYIADMNNARIRKLVIE
jgi:DNA-binding beta-propeller fold protein YncE